MVTSASQKFYQLCSLILLLNLLRTMATEVALTTEPPLEYCTVETHACQCQCEATSTTSPAQQVGAVAPDTLNAVTSLSFMVWDIQCLRISLHIEDFEKMTGIQVNIDCFQAPMTRDEYHEEVFSDAKLQTGLYDGYTLGPHLFGDLDLVEGLHDLTPLVRSGTIGNMAGYDFAWNDMFLFYRENGAVYDRQIVGIPIDGDVHTLFYRADLFAKYNKVPPATWEEYTELAKFFHNKEELVPGTNRTVPISGSCVGKKERTEFWVFLIMSSMTQFQGTRQGAFFDTRNGKNMEPLLGEAFVKTLQYMEEQMIYGADGEYDGDFKSININKFNEGKCALTYMWGDLYKESSKAPPTSYVSGFVGTAFTPGSRKYLNRDSQMLEPCTEDSCSCGNIHFAGKESDTCINSAPYAAYTGWTAGCSNYTSPAQKVACAEFWGYISSPETSVVDTIPDITPLEEGAPFIGVDPYRKSQTNLDEWVERGLPENTTRQFLETIKVQLDDTNVVLDMRIPATSSFQKTTNDALKRHLKKVQERMDSGITGDDILSTEEERWQTERELRKAWRQVITDYDKVQSLPLLEAYQRNLGIYNPDDNASNQLGVGSIVGITVGIIALIAVSVLLIVREKNKQSDAIWQIEPGEIKYEDPATIAGRGRFGLVLVGEYRGTEVAVKRVLPKKKKKAIAGQSTLGAASLVGWVKDDASCVTEQPPPTSMFSTANAGDLVSNKNGENNNTPSSSGDHMSGCSEGDHRKLKKEFIKEMRLLSKLRHPCITTVIGAVVNSKEDPMLVMEYMNHGSLYDILRNETMVLEGSMLLQILRDISQGVRFLHSFDPQIVHCDLKANNILVDNRWRAKVADFGLSTQDRKDTASGTPYWMAPELLLQMTTNTAASDVYAFGIILYEVFSRKDPYEGEDPMEVLKSVCDPNVNKRPPMPRGCPPQIDSMMKDCLVADPEGRPTFEELDKRLKRVEVKEVETQQEKLSVSLFDIFPQHIADALKAGRPVQPEHKEVVTIFFSDIVGFTDLSAVLEPQKVSNMLGRLYDKLDALSNKHEVFKVETIGDAYMAVTNLVKDQSEDHVKRIADFSADAIAAANDTLVDEEDPSKGCLNIRVGFHTGPVMADVVGSLNPRYCLFGDSVNTSSLIERNSVANRILCSDASAKLLMKQNPGMEVATRGMINIKGKGLMLTYWVNEKADKVNDRVSERLVNFKVEDEEDVEDPS